MQPLVKNSPISPLQLTDIAGQIHSIPAPNCITHLQFRRFAGCPICNIHMGQLKARKDELTRAGVREIIVFYSQDKKVQEFLSDIPFILIADPQRRLYQQFGVEQSVFAVLDPRAWPAAIKGAAMHIKRIWQRLPKDDESLLGLPADFLIDQSGKLVDLSYGSHAYDQWSVDEILAKAAALTSQQ